jgi:hypothetical protein
MTGLMLVTLGLSVPAYAAAPENRCGWLVNPTPANWWLSDRDGEWLLGTQGGYQAPGLDDIPDMSGPQWVETNAGGYGYGCACLTVVVNQAEHRVDRLLAAKQLPLSRCRSDRSLPRPQ